MPGEELAALAKDERALSAVLFMSGVMMALDSYSSIMSSPWSAETFGADSDKADSARSYSYQSAGVSMILGLVSSYVGASPWPFIGVSVTNAYMLWTYRKALAKAARNGGGADEWRSYG